MSMFNPECRFDVVNIKLLKGRTFTFQCFKCLLGLGRQAQTQSQRP